MIGHIPKFKIPKLLATPPRPTNTKWDNPIPATSETTKPTLSPYPTVTPTYHKTDPLQQKNSQPATLIQNPHINLDHTYPELKAFLSGSPVSTQGDTSAQAQLKNHLHPLNQKPSNKTPLLPKSDRRKDTLPGSTPQSPILVVDKYTEQWEIDKVGDHFDSINTPTTTTHIPWKQPYHPSEETPTPRKIR